MVKFVVCERLAEDPLGRKRRREGDGEMSNSSHIDNKGTVALGPISEPPEVTVTEGQKTKARVLPAWVVHAEKDKDGKRGKGENWPWPTLTRAKGKGGGGNEEKGNGRGSKFPRRRYATDSSEEADRRASMASTEP